MTMFIPTGNLPALPIQAPANTQAANEPQFCNLPSQA